MSQNIQIDPTKKDYVFENGSPIASDRVLEAAYFALTIPLNKWVYGQNGQGSLLYTLENIKKTSDVEQRFSSLVRGAIQRQVIDTGKATKVTVTNLETTKTGTNNNIEIVPSAVQLSNELSFDAV